MTDSEALFDQPERIPPPRRELTAPVDKYLVVNADERRSALVAELADVARAVLKLHYPISWYEECGEDCPTPEDEHVLIGDDEMWTCERSRVGTKCAECTPECPDSDQGRDYPCDTVKAVTDGLGGQGPHRAAQVQADLIVKSQHVELLAGTEGEAR